MTTISLEGAGVTVSFSASGFSGDVIDITLSEKARETIETTHLGTEKNKTFKLGEYVDLGTLSIRVDHNPALINLMGYPAESIVISYPLQKGEVVPQKLTLNGIVYSQGGEKMKMDERMVTALQIRLTNNLTTDTIFDSPPVNLIDGSKILGAYDFGSASYSTANIVTIAPAGNYNLTYEGLPAPTSLPSGYSGYGQSMGAYHYSAGATCSNAISTSITMALFIKATGPGIVRMGSSSALDSFFSVLFVITNSSPPGGVGGLLPLFTDGVWHHYAITVVKGGLYHRYRDGVLFDSGFVSNATPISLNYIKHYGINDAPNASWDNIFFSAEALTAPAIAALAAGRMPNSSGVLA